MNSEKPSWASTNLSCRTILKIWELQAYGYNIDKTDIYLQQHPNEYPDYPNSRDTVSKVRKDLKKIPIELARDLVQVKPIIKVWLEDKKPEWKGKIASLNKLPSQHIIMGKAIEEHFLYIKKIANELTLLGEDNLEVRLSSKLKGMVDVVCTHYGVADFGFFLEHFQAEYPEVQSRDDYLVMAENDPQGLLKKLKTIGGRGILKGKCEQCPHEVEETNYA